MEKINVFTTVYKHRINDKGEVPIVVCVSLNNKVVYYDPLHKKVKLSLWDASKREVMKEAPNSSPLNSLIRKRVAELQNEYLQKELQGIKLTSAKIKKIGSGEDFQKDFIAYCKARIPERYSKATQKETRRSYRGEVSKMAEFQQDISFGDLDPHFFSKYKAWMIATRGNSDNTIWKAFKFINTMINDAIPAGYIKENPFKDYDRGTYKQGKRDFLDISDCDKIHALLLTDIPERLRLVGIYYLFMCYTGFRFRDATKFFNYSTHVIDNERIVIDTEKTGTEVNILIHSRLRKILDVIKTSPLQISNKEFNSYTKVLATMAKIPVSITAHSGRHTFGANLAQLGIPIERAQKLMGHKDKRSTDIYYHINDRSLDTEMRKWDEN